MNELLVAMHPVIGTLAIKRPVSLVGVDGPITAREFLGNVIDHNLSLLCQYRLESDEGRRRESDSEHLLDGLRHLAITIL